MTRLLAIIRRHAMDRGRSAAIVGDDTVIRYQELPALIRDRARLIADRGCHVLGLQLDNGPDWILWDLACIEAGVVCVPLPLFFNAEQRAHAIAAAGIDHLVTTQGISATGIRAAVKLPDGTHKITFTSGTTAAPKGVCLSSAGMDKVAQDIVDAIGAETVNRHLSVLPLAILLENIAGAHAALLAGGSVYVPGPARLGLEQPLRPDYRRLLQVMRETEIHTAILVPELLRGLTAQLERERLAVPALRFLAVGGAKIAPDLILRARALGLPVFEGYGLSECASVVALNTPAHDRPGSAGRLLPHVDAVEQQGQIVVRNPAFLGYIGEPRSGSLVTGDLGVIDADGFVHLHGRSRNVIITAYGRNISPEWIESILLDQPEIAQAVVHGDGRPHLGALIVPANASADVAAAIGRTNRQLPEYARVMFHDVVQPFTVANGQLTANGRPRREAIFKEYQSFVTQEQSHEFL